MESEIPLKQWINKKTAVALTIAFILAVAFVTTAQRGGHAFIMSLYVLPLLLLSVYGVWSRDILTSFFTGFGAGILVLVWYFLGHPLYSEFIPLYAILPSIGWGVVGVFFAFISQVLKNKRTRWFLLLIWIGVILFLFSLAVFTTI